jgi:hypothetical protein
MIAQGVGPIFNVQTNDLRIGCESPFSLVELIKMDLILKKELEQFKKAFEKEKNLDT